MAIQIRSAGPKVTFWGQNLKLLNPTLFANVRNQSGDPLEGHVTIYTNKLDPDIREQLMESLVLLGKMPAPGSLAEHEAMNKAILDDATRRQAEEAQRKALEDSGHAQLAAYKKVGLLDTKRNAEIIRDAIARHDRGIFCSISVRNAVEAERSNLSWGKVEAPAPVAAPPAPAEPQVRLSDGSMSLPLDKPVPKSASVEQARDWLARTRAKEQPGIPVVAGFKTALR
jgi:hypothetical protein